jgi:hypothetical protein
MASDKQPLLLGIRIALIREHRGAWRDFTGRAAPGNIG